MPKGHLAWKIPAVRKLLKGRGVRRLEVDMSNFEESISVKMPKRRVSLLTNVTTLKEALLEGAREGPKKKVVQRCKFHHQS